MSLWLLESEDRTLAVVSAGGRRKALLTLQRAEGYFPTLHYSGREPYLLRVADVPGAVKANEALIVDGEVRSRAEVLAEREQERS